MKPDNTPVVKDLVLIGGGHSHLSVLRYFGMHPVAGLRLTLITRDLHTPYSGMLPGFIAGHYSYDDAHIDLRPLALFAGARVIHAEVNGLDLEESYIICPSRPPISFDLLSINIGSRPSAIHIPGAEEFSMPVKPIDRFLLQWNQLAQRVFAANGNFRIGVVGGGAGGVEMALATQYRLQKALKEQNHDTNFLEYHLFTEGDTILSTHNAKVQRNFEKVLAERGIHLHTHHEVDEVREDQVHCSNGNSIPVDAVIWVTDASAPAWLRRAGLSVDQKGFIAVNDTLESTSHTNIFAAGDIASVLNHPRPKSGVFAVRQGPPLARNLARAAKGKTLKDFKPQKEFLGLISTGDKYAIASRNKWSMQGEWLWKIKDRIDRKFMEKFSDLPDMAEEEKSTVAAGLADDSAIQEISAMAMRCGGCGAKVGSTVLSRVINKLQPIQRDDVLIGLNDPDDAAVTEVPAGKVVVQSVDYFRSFIDDPFIFGKIASNHALSDIFAMGADTQSAMAIATIPYGLESQVEEDLYQMMSGAVEVLNESGTALVGGHSSEGAELSFGLSVTGLADKDSVLKKSGMQPGDFLVLTKPLGTGTLFAADMRRKAKGRWVDAALQHMLQSNQQAGHCMHRYGANACTDVTGFGLLGHLVEMTRASGMEVVINLESLPLMDGALKTLQLGIFSSLQEQNVRLRRAIHDAGDLLKHSHFPMLFDPQTSGGLLAAIPTDQVESCIQELQALGYDSTVIIGQVNGDSGGLESVRLMA